MTGAVVSLPTRRLACPTIGRTTEQRASLRVAIVHQDAHARALPVAVGGLAAVAALSLAGVPAVGLHGSLHHLGVMDLLCGGTRALRLAGRGQMAAAWRFNPLGPILVVGAVATVGRYAVGRRTGQWLTIDVAWRAAAVRWVVAALVAALELNQQLHASMLR